MFSFLPSFPPSPPHFFPDYQRDPYAERNPCNTICCREDLNPSFPVPAGCYDSKVDYLHFNICSTFAVFVSCQTCSMFSCTRASMARSVCSLFSCCPSASAHLEMVILCRVLSPVRDTSPGTVAEGRGYWGRCAKELRPWELVVFRG